MLADTIALTACRSVACWLCRPLTVLVVQHRQQRADAHGRAFSHGNLAHHAGYWRWHLGVNLISRHLKQRLILLCALAMLLEPLTNRPFGHTLAELRHL